VKSVQKPIVTLYYNADDIFFLAITDKMLPELGMNTNDFNYGQTIFLVSFLSAELPSGLISKKVGPDR